MLTKQDHTHINTAFEIAKSTERVRGSRMAAVLVRKNKVVGVGFNHMKSHPFQTKYARNEHAIFFHAETHAIKNALQTLDVDDLEKCTLYIARARQGDGKDKRHWEYGSSKPCAGCARCINEFGIRRVVYTENGNEVVMLDNYDLNIKGYK